MQQFWIAHPALMYGLALLLGLGTFLHGCWSLWIPLALFAFSLCFPHLSIGIPRLLLALLCTLSVILWTNAYYKLPPLPEEGVVGSILFKTHSISLKNTAFGKRWIYQGTALCFYPEEQQELYTGAHMPCTVQIPYSSQENRPRADSVYLLKGRMKESSANSYFFVPKTIPWQIQEESWSMAEWRYRAKRWLKGYIARHIPGKQEAALLAGLVTGEFEDRLLSYEFGRFGLQHIMAISGFHFSIIAAILGSIFSLAISRRISLFCLIFALSGYFCFLGYSPSIFRAWIACMLALGGLLLQRNSCALNSLGAGLFILLIFDPLKISHLGFQFSFLTTAAILLLYPGCDLLFQQLFTKRSLSQMVEMDRFNQHGYCLLAVFRQGLALTLAVNLAAAPLMLYYFHKFPLMGLAYNLFFPFLISISMLLLILGLLATPWAPLAELLHMTNQKFTHYLLNLTHNMPSGLDVALRIPEIPSPLLIGYLTLLFAGGMSFKLRMQSDDAYTTASFYVV